MFKNCYTYHGNELHSGYRLFICCARLSWRTKINEKVDNNKISLKWNQNMYKMNFKKKINTIRSVAVWIPR